MSSSRSAGPRSRAGIGRAGRGSRSVSVLYGTFSAVLVVAALVMALIVRPPPPPSIAALGPSPQDQIEKARQNQAAGSGPGEVATTPPTDEQSKTSAQQDGPSATSTTSPTTSPPMEVPTTRRCFGDPPRQTEDPHSPPCVFEVFHGDNGGRTAPGVTATEIHVVFQFATWCYTEDTKSVIEALSAHFNRRYEFYGRRVVIDYIETNGPCAYIQSNPSESSALANEVISQHPFASIIDAPLPFQGEFHRRLSETGIHSIQAMRPAFSPSELVDGWTWLLSPALDVNQRLGGDFVCRALVGRPARHAGPGVDKRKPRTFAVIPFSTTDSPPPGVDALMGRLKACDATAKRFPYRKHAPDPSGTGTASLMAQIEAEDYTTIIPACAVCEVFKFQVGATSNSYFPEWVIIDLHEEDQEWRRDKADSPSSQQQSPYTFGFTSHVRVRPNIETPAFWALEEGGGPSNPIQTNVVENVYKQLLVLASGIQGAGPHLTPGSFRDALWRTVWPNPNPGGPPYWQQEASLGPGDPTFYDDYAIWWWNPNAETQTSIGANDNDGRGSFCYLNRGGRFVPGAFPANADRRLFSEMPCR